MTRPAARRRVVQRILDLYVRLPDTPARPRPPDYRMLNALLDRGIEPADIEHALLLGTARRRFNGEPPYPPISTFAYFVPVVEEVLGNPLQNTTYRDYVRRRAEPLLLPDREPPARRASRQLRLPF